MKHGIKLVMLFLSFVFINDFVQAEAVQPKSIGAIQAETKSARQKKIVTFTKAQSQALIYKIRSQIMANNEARALSLLNDYPALDVNVSDKMGYSLLTEAVINVHLDLVKTLLSRGADPNLEYKRGPALLLATTGIVGNFSGPAIDERLRNIAMEDDRMLDEEGIKREMKRLRKDKKLLQKWYRWNEKQRSDQTAIVSMLLMKGADINAIDSSGRNALHLVFSQYMPTYAMVNSLLQAGVKLNIKDMAGMTALDYANRAYHYTGQGRKIIRLLKRKGAKYGKYLDTSAYKKPQPKRVDQKQNMQVENVPGQELRVDGENTIIYDRLILPTKYVKYIKFNRRPGIYDQYVIRNGKTVTNLMNTIWPHTLGIKTKDKVILNYQGEDLYILKPKYYKNGNIKEGILWMKNIKPIKIGNNKVFLSRLELIEFYPGGQIKAASIKYTQSPEGRWVPFLYAGNKGWSWNISFRNKVIFSPEGKTLTVITWIREGGTKGPVWIYIYKVLKKH